ncbi:hypothetical protein ABT203_34750 [Streptomyces sp900105245]|uniref:hypothetical protein n=1 Tax=Streptomyces sp. 900105245 TaxID=3154379 RepID=UPI00332DB285
MVLRETKKDALESGFMPRARLLDRSKPLEAFAADLRRLRDAAPPRRFRKKQPLKRQEPAGRRVLAPLTVDQVVTKHGVGRSSIYAALSGRRLPSTTLLRVMVLAWDPKGAEAIPQWMDRRREVEAALSLEGPDPGRSTAPAPAGDTGKPVEPDAPEPAPAGRPEPARSFPSQAPASSPLSTEIKRLYEAAGSPSVRQISAAVLTDSQSADISPETVRRVVAGTHARRTSVASVVRALAAINGADVSAAEERALGLRTLEESTTDVDPGLSVTAADPARVDLRGAVIHGLHLIAKGKAEAVSPEFFAGAGRYVMTASAASEQAADSAGRGQPSPFTQVLVDGLLFGAQGSHETGQLGAHELYQYVFKELPEKFPRPQERASGMGDTPLARRKTKSFTQPIAGHEVAPKGLIRPAGEDAATGSGAPMSSPIAQALGVSRRRAGEYSIGDYHAWKAVMLLDLLVAIFGFLSWQTWLLEPYGLSGGDVEAVLFFSAVLAVLSFLLASSEGLTLAYLARKFKRATGVRGGSMREVPGYVRKEILERRSVVMVRLVGNIVGCFFGLAWFVALTSLSFRADAYSLFMATLGALCFISLLRLVKMGDALFIAGALISFLGIFPKQGDLGYDAGEFGFGASLQGMAFLAMLCAWLFRLSNKALFLAAGLALIPAAIAYPAYQLLVGISLAGVTLAFIGVLMGDGVPLEEDGRSPVGAVIHRLGGGR